MFCKQWQQSSADHSSCTGSIGKCILMKSPGGHGFTKFFRRREERHSNSWLRVFSSVEDKYYSYMSQHRFDADLILTIVNEDVSKTWARDEQTNPSAPKTVWQYVSDKKVFLNWYFSSSSSVLSFVLLLILIYSSQQLIKTIQDNLYSFLSLCRDQV